MNIVHCPRYGDSIDVSTVVPEPDGRSEVMTCDCGQAFAYRTTDIVQLTLETKAAKAA